MLSTDETSHPDSATPIAKAREYAERAENMYIAPGQATVSALLALFWLKVAELEALESSNPTKLPPTRPRTNGGRAARTSNF